MARPQRFKLTSLNTGNYWWIYIYDHVDELREAANKYTNGREPAGISWAETYGVHHPFIIENVSKSGKITRKKWVGIIRFAKDYVTPGIVAHELMHAALQDYRVDNEGPANFGWSDTQRKMEKEEHLAYIYGALFEELNQKLHNLNIW